MQYLKSDVRSKILASAVSEFKQYGYADASIRNIANNAEISLGNIYRYYQNKEALYMAVIDPFLDGIRQSVEIDLIFKGKTMKERAELLVDFLMRYNDELLVIRKGNSVHYESFVKYIVEVIARRIKEFIVTSFPEINEKIKNPNFYEAIAEGFATSLFKVIDNNVDRETQARNCREIITFYFGHMKDRYYHFDY